MGINWGLFEVGFGLGLGGGGGGGGGWGLSSKMRLNWGFV